MTHTEENFTITLDVNFDIIDCSETLANFMGLEPADIIHNPYLEICETHHLEPALHPNFAYLLQNETKQSITLMRRNHKIETLVWQICYKKSDGPDSITYEMQGKIFNPENNHANYTEDYLNSVINHMPGYLYIKDVNRVYVACNNNFARSAGFDSPMEVIGKTDSELAWGPTEAELYRISDEKVLAGQAKTNFEEPQTQADGRETIVLASKVPLIDKTNKLLGILGIYTDITELKLAKQAAEKANIAKSNFLATMSHEFRTPINATMGVAQILKREALSSRQDKLIDVIFKSGKNLQRMVDDVLNFSRLEVGKMEIKEDVFDLKKLISEIVFSIKYQLEDKDVSLNIDYTQKIPKLLIGDMLRVRQILLNLITNAIKFTEQGKIILNVVCKPLSADQMSVTTNISDTGCGIPADKLSDIFQRFTQVEYSYSRRHEGAGLGLAICKQLVEAMNGSIGVQSKLGEGSNFHFTIPFRLAKENQHSLETNRQGTISISSPQNKVSLAAHVLLVEDNVLNQIVAREMISRTGCTVDVAKNAEVALEKLSHNTHDIILTDIGLPGMDGIELIRAIRKNETGPKKMPIIAVTAHVLEEDRNKCIAAGANGVLLKPIIQEELLETLINYCSSYKIN